MRAFEAGAIALLLLLLELLAAGCAGRSALGGRARGEAVREMLLLPLNVVVPIPPGLEPGAASVETELRTYLESHGKRVEALAPREAHAAWLAAARALKTEVGEEKMSFEGAAGVLARELGREGRFDALVLAWIALRPAKVRGRVVTWDGVSRTLRVVNADGRRLAALEDFEAQAAVPSLQVVVFSPEGEKLFEGVGGLDLVHALAVEGDPPTIAAVPRPSAEVFSDLTPLREGIAAALDPFLPRREGDEPG